MKRVFLATKTLPLITVVLLWQNAALCASMESKTSSITTTKDINTSKTTVDNTAEKNSKFSGTWYMRMLGDRIEDSYSQKSISRLFMGANVTYQAIEELSFNLFPRFKYVSGYAQTKDTSDVNTSTWSIRNATADLSLTKYDTLSAGALDQSKIHHSILLDEIAFPGVRLDIHTDKKNIAQIGVVGEGAVPTSSSLTTETQEFEKTPGYQSLGAYFKYTGNVLEYNGRALYYAYSDLPIAVATPSGLLGNSTESTSGTNTKFIYEYKGYQADSNIKWHVNKSWALGINGAWLRNKEAPQDLNQGILSNAYTEIQTTKNLLIKPFYIYYRIEPDATVAKYNDDGYNTNRTGYRTGMSFEFKKTVKFTASGGERDAIYKNISQQKENYWTIKLETLDAAI